MKMVKCVKSRAAAKRGCIEHVQSQARERAVCWRFETRPAKEMIKLIIVSTRNGERKPVQQEHTTERQCTSSRCQAVTKTDEYECQCAAQENEKRGDISYSYNAVFLI